MLKEKLKDNHIILASGSPRRQQYFNELGVEFEVRLKEIEEVYPSHLKGSEISDYLAKLKASTFLAELKSNDILITSDTVVWHNDKSLAKPANTKEAFEMLNKLSGSWHDVITSVCITWKEKQEILNATTRVKIKTLTKEEINFYVIQYKPFDKAGGYGIQEWLGLVAIEEINGSYTNVVGLPTHLVYKTLMQIK